MRRGRLVGVVAVALVALAWFAAYSLWPRFSFDDGPYTAELYTGDLTALLPVSSTELKLVGNTIFVLETWATAEEVPRAVIVLKGARGHVQWARVASSDFGPIRITERGPRWYVPGGWVVPIKPERTEAGELYLSPWGEFRFLLHSW